MLPADTPSGAVRTMKEHNAYRQDDAIKRRAKAGAIAFHRTGAMRRAKHYHHLICHCGEVVLICNEKEEKNNHCSSDVG